MLSRSLHRPVKLNPVQWIVILFLLLVIPLGIYMYQTQNVGETRSKAANEEELTAPAMPSTTPGENQTVTKEKHPQGGVTGASGVLWGVRPTSAPTESVTDTCNSWCTDDAACGEGLICTKIRQAGICRNPGCFRKTDCVCD
jgi:hypothetical protein